MKTVKMKVNGIHCGGCANKIQNGMKAIDSEIVTNVDVQNGMVSISFDKNKASINDLKNKIVEVGFQVENVELE